MRIGDLLDTLYIQRNSDTATHLAALLRGRGWKPMTTEFYAEFVVGTDHPQTSVYGGGQELLAGLTACYNSG